MQRAIGVVWLGMVALLSGAAVWAEEYRPGDKVVVIEDANLTVSGNKVVTQVFPGLVLTVEDTNGDWLWLSNGKPGWLPSKSVIPLDRRAIGRLTDMIKANPTANLYSGRGSIWSELGELNIALADYDEAIRLDPKAAAYYNNRGSAWKENKDFDKAMQDYDEAIRLDPSLAAAYHNRGVAWSAKQEYDKAIRDYNESIRLDPKDAHSYLNRGLIWSSKQEYDKAIADYREALRIDPKDESAAFSIGVLFFVTRDKQAPDQFQVCIDVLEWSGSYAAYSVILGTQSAQLLGKAERAKKFLDDSAGKLKTDWPFPVVQLLRGELDEPELMALATDNDKQTEVHCYLGLQQLFANHPDEARTHLHWVRDHGNIRFIEYVISIAELKRLDQK